MIRILYVHHGKGIGGAPLSLLYLIRGLDRSRFYPTVLCLYESEAVELFRREGIETFVARGIHDFSHTNVYWYDLWQFPKALLRLLQIPLSIERTRKFLVKHKFDIVHLNTSTLLASGIAAKREGLKVVWHIREPVHKGYFGLRRSMVRKIIDEYSDVIIPICRYDAEQLIFSVKIHVVYNFIDFGKFNPTLKAPHLYNELGIDPSHKIVTMLGGINPIKGTIEFIQAAVRVFAENPNVVFFVAGPIPKTSIRNRLNGLSNYYQKVKKIIGESRYPESIRFIGVRNDIPELLSITNVLCFPSTVPHFARPIIEASAMGVPVIASDLGGPRELVMNGTTGFLVSTNDEDELARTINVLIHDEELAHEMGMNGVEFAREKFSAEKNIQEIIKLYDSIVP